MSQHFCHLFSEYKEAFNLYDKDKDGIIATQKLGRVLRAMGLNPTEIEIQEMIDEIDSESKLLVQLNVEIGLKQMIIVEEYVVR